MQIRWSRLYNPNISKFVLCEEACIGSLTSVKVPPVCVLEEYVVGDFFYVLSSKTLFVVRQESLT